MVLLNSEKQKLGKPMPAFQLPTVEGDIFSSSDFFEKKVLVVMFICNHCPYVRAIEDRLIQLSVDYSSKSVQLVGICSNDPTDYPDDRPENLLKRWKEKKYGFPYLIDQKQDVAKAFGAVCTPDIFVYGTDRKLEYHGQIDNNWKEPEKVTRKDIHEAIDALLAGKKPDSKQIPSMGCSIKWKNG